MAELSFPRPSSWCRHTSLLQWKLRVTPLSNFHWINVLSVNNLLWRVDFVRLSVLFTGDYSTQAHTILRTELVYIMWVYTFCSCIGYYIQDQHLHQLMTTVRGGNKHGFYDAYAKQVSGEIVSLLRNHALRAKHNLRLMCECLLCSAVLLDSILTWAYEIGFYTWAWGN